MYPINHILIDTPKLVDCITKLLKSDITVKNIIEKLYSNHFWYLNISENVCTHVFSLRSKRHGEVCGVRIRSEKDKKVYLCSRHNKNHEYKKRELKNNEKKCISISKRTGLQCCHKTKDKYCYIHEKSENKHKEKININNINIPSLFKNKINDKNIERIIRIKYKRRKNKFYLYKKFLLFNNSKYLPFL
jgi:Fe-S-cluster containining protein